MTPQEKAEEILERFGNIEIFISQEPKDIDCKLNDLPSRWWIKQQCALIAVDEIIIELTQEISPSVHGFRHNYWKEVKEEIEKL